MLLLALAPTISQVLGAHAPHHGRVEHVAAGHAGHAAHMVHAQLPADDDCAGDCWRRCGYCDFFAHTPALAYVAQAILISPLRPAVPLTRHRIEPRIAQRFSSAQPRGPPDLG